MPTLSLRWYLHSVRERFPFQSGGTQPKDVEKLAGLRLPHTRPHPLPTPGHPHQRYPPFIDEHAKGSWHLTHGHAPAQTSVPRSPEQRWERVCPCCVGLTPRGLPSSSSPRICFPLLSAAELRHHPLLGPFPGRLGSSAPSQRVGVPGTQPSHACTCCSPAPRRSLLAHSYRGRATGVPRGDEAAADAHPVPTHPSRNRGAFQSPPTSTYRC